MAKKMRTNKRLLRWVLIIAGLLCILGGVSLFSLFVGSAEIPFQKVVALFMGNGTEIERNIIFDIRLPRIILAIAVGGALSIAGVLLQGMFRNPLVEPYTLGISGGAALGVCVTIVCRLHRWSIVSLPLAGFIGALTVIIYVYCLSMRKSIIKLQGILLTGIMISFISSSLVMFLMAVSRTEDLHGIIHWIMGSLTEPNITLIYLVTGISFLGLIVSYLFYPALNAFALGEEEALHLGINIERVKKMLFLLASVLTGVSVSVTGVIGFIGLVIPHFVRLCIGSDHRISLAASYLAGGAFLVICDTLARTVISPVELPVGVVTGIIGGSLFVYALSKKS